MAKETLHVELESDLVERVRRYSQEHGTDVAGTIGELISSLPSAGVGEVAGPMSDAESEEQWIRDLPPLTRSLLGIAGGDADEEDYKEYLWRKYGP